ncbi:MAG: hypothetical protein PHT16_02775 [Candidatus Pacebacteria bacterium]|nr:hypothetical protein [Candidatus Paceibacterota bacterium]
MEKSQVQIKKTTPEGKQERPPVLYHGSTVLNIEEFEPRVCIYKVPSDSFDLTTTEQTGETYDSKVPVRPISSERFNSVSEAIKKFGGEIIFK